MSGLNIFALYLTSAVSGLHIYLYLISTMSGLHVSNVFNCMLKENGTKACTEVERNAWCPTQTMDMQRCHTRTLAV